MNKLEKTNAEEVLKELRTGLNGLTEKEASERLEKHGFNELVEKKKTTPATILLRQFGNFMLWVLFAAALTSYFTGETLNFWVIIAIIAFIIALGFIQEFKAEKSIEALQKMIAPTARVTVRSVAPASSSFMERPSILIESPIWTI